MKKAAGVILIVVGVLVLVFRGFDYTKEENRARLGPVELSVRQKERVQIPVWVGVVAILGGTVLLVAGRK